MCDVCVCDVQVPYAGRRGELKDNWTRPEDIPDIFRNDISISLFKEPIEPADINQGMYKHTYIHTYTS